MFECELSKFSFAVQLESYKSQGGHSGEASECELRKVSFAYAAGKLQMFKEGAC